MTTISNLAAGLLLTATLCACDDSADTASGAAADAAPAAVEMLPGLWEATVTMAGVSESQTECITAEQIGDAGFLHPDADESACRFAERRMADGIIALDVTCDGDDGPSRLRANGSYGADRYRIAMRVGEGEVAGLHDGFTVQARRVAATCRAER